jgi:hypothetical protein
MQPTMRRLPDGTWYNTQTNVVQAPLADPMGGGTYKRQAAPGVGPQGVPFVGQPPNPEAQMINGLGASPMPGAWGMHMRQGRNYPALGQLGEGTKNFLLMGAVVGIAALTVWLQRRGKKSKK